MKYSRWSFMDMGAGFFVAERIVNGESEQKNIKAHCLACAKSDILAKYGGQVDIRGWQKQGTCGLFLKAMSLGDNDDNS